jgi:hypothetical protein
VRKAIKQRSAKQSRKRGSKRHAGKKVLTVGMAAWRAARVVRKLRSAKRRHQGTSSPKKHEAKRSCNCRGKCKCKGKKSSGSGARSVGSVAVGSFALGASAFGALAVGAVAIRRLAIKRAAVGRLDVSEVKVGRLEVDELIVHSHSGPSSPSPTTLA